MNDTNLTKEKKTPNFLIPFIVCLTLLAFSLLYIGIDKLYLSKSKTSPNQENETTNKDSIDATEDSEPFVPQITNPKCTGIYTGTYAENSIINYNLNSDSTFTASYNGTSGTFGMFVINDNTISFIGLKDTPGQREQDPLYETQDFVIADDCSSILYKNGD